MSISLLRPRDEILREMEDQEELVPKTFHDLTAGMLLLPFIRSWQGLEPHAGELDSRPLRRSANVRR